MSLKSQNVLFLDLQTTGAKPGNADILEIAFLHGEAMHSSLVQLPEGKEIPRQIQFITGIKNEMLVAAPALPEVLAKLKKVLKGLASAGSDNTTGDSHVAKLPIVVIHFAQFERPFLQDAFAKIGEEMPFEILCTNEIAKRLLPNLPTRGIKGLAGYFGCPSGELKRAEGHVEATRIIWQGLIPALEEKGITTMEGIKSWLTETPKAARGKYEYPLPKEKRLELPKQPGVYRMLSRWGEILYVGKATSLHDRVNSYFRGQKNRDSKKLEMLTQVYDLRVTPVGSPLEAALLETDEIKKWNPPYNIALKTGRRELVFFNRDFTSSQAQACEEHFIGPFSSAMALDSMLRLCNSLQSKEFDENMFYEPMEISLLQEGFKIFCERHAFVPETFTSMRAILAVGLNWYRQLAEEVEDLEAEESTEETESTTIDQPLDESSGQSDEDEVVVTAEDIADKFERHFTRAGATYLRTKKLTQLLNSSIEIQKQSTTKKSKSPEKMQLRIRNGEVLPSEAEASDKLKIRWQNLSIETYDRMTVLFTEINKLKDQDHQIVIENI